MKLTERVYLVGSGSFGVGLTDAYDCNVYLVDGVSEAALIDAGGGQDIGSIIRVIEDDGIPLERIRRLYLTHGHGDHAGGAALLKEALGLEVFAAREIADALRQGDETAIGIGLDKAKQAGIYPPDFSFQACAVDGELKDGDRAAVGDLELLVVETPGHSAGHLSYVMEREGVTHLFGGDAVFYGGRIALQNLPDCDLQAQLRTIERLSRLAVDVFLPGHLCFALRDGQQHLDAAMAVLKGLGVPPNLS